MAFGQYEPGYDPSYDYQYHDYANSPNGTAGTPAVPPPPGDGGGGLISSQLAGLGQKNVSGAPGGGGVGGVGGGGGGIGGDGSLRFNFGAVPVFKPDMFSAPTYADAQAEPGYKFRLNSGTDALERSASAKGVLRTGGTLKDIIEYGQNFGAAEYNNVFNRALQGYGAKYNAQKDIFAPLMAQWQNAAQAERARVLAQYQGNIALEIARMSRGGGGSSAAQDAAAALSQLGDPPVFPGGGNTV